jgi:hypothetical protein
VLRGQDWVSVFHGGAGTITIKDHATGATYLTAQIPLTPGPSVVVIKDSCALLLLLPVVRVGRRVHPSLHRTAHLIIAAAHILCACAHTRARVCRGV